MRHLVPVMARPALIVVVMVWLAGCGAPSPSEPLTDSRTPPALAPRFWAPPGWAWGLIVLKDRPAVRYGVAGPAAAPRGHVLILTGYSEPAEKYFETVRDLTAAGYVTWVLERAGQGGSGRLSGPRDLGRDHGDDDALALRVMTEQVVRPGPGRPLAVLAHSMGAQAALGALGQGMGGVSVLILSSPTLALAGGSDAPAVQARWGRRLGLGGVRAPGTHGWSRQGPDGVGAHATSDRARGAVQLAWQQANPDLRMGGPTIGWAAGFFERSRAILAMDLKALRTPVRILSAGDEAYADIASQDRLCTALFDCRLRRYPAARHELHMEAEPLRRQWLAAVRTALADHGL